MKRVAVVVLGLAVAAWCTGCSDHTPQIPASAAPVSTTTTVADLAASDGQRVAAADVDRIVGALSGPAAQEAALDPAATRALVNVQLLAVGLTEAEAACVTAKIQAKGASSTTQVPTAAGVAGAPSGLDPADIAGCVAVPRMAQLASAKPDLTRVPAATIRQAVTKVAMATLTTAGFTPDEAACVAGHGLDGVSDDQLAGLLSGSVPESQMRTGVTACLTAQRVRDLAHR